MRRDSLLGDLLEFSGRLRVAGLDVHTGRVLDVIQALRYIDLDEREAVYHTLRTLLVHRHDDFPIFDGVFSEYFSLEKPSSRQVSGAESRAKAEWQGVETGGLVSGDVNDGPPATAALRTWSDVERIASKDFAALNAGELALVRSAIDRLTWTPGVRRTRRWIPGRGRRIDLRRALARSLRTGGDITTLPRRKRRVRPRPLVLLCDVSGSMERYSRTLLHFAHALSRTHRVEAFLFSTRLTRITMALRTARADAAIAAASRAVHDWSGGTRIGSALRVFHQRWRRALHGGPVVLLISDGWDRGDSRVLRDEMARLQRTCHRLIWLNPLIGTVDYAPLTQGLQAALPFVDDFLPVRTLRDVRDLALHLSALEGPS
jgi:uncharacterized protein with von Willebrand factor type A (vWA) domain